MTTEEPRALTRSVSATPSLACDLSWLLSVAARPSMQARYPQLAEVFDGREELARRVRMFWPDDPEESCFSEMLVLAHHAGALGQTDPGALWEAIAAAVPTVPLDLPLPSESPEERAVILARIRRLRRSRRLLGSYLELLADVWEPVDALWQRSLPVIEQTGRHVLSEYRRGRPLEAFLTPACEVVEARLPEITANVHAGQPLLFVPCLFFGTSLYLEFPDLAVVGTGVGPGDALARARTESVARRLKAVADPTRLALLHSLASAPSTIGELAALFCLAQPTVSLHMKVLRQSGLVQATRGGGSSRAFGRRHSR